MTRIRVLLHLLQGSVPPLLFGLLVVLLTFPSWGMSSLWALPIVLGLYTGMFVYFLWEGQVTPQAELQTVRVHQNPTFK